MTDRVRTLTIVLEQDMRTDDVETVIDALKMIRCVQDVILGEVVEFNHHHARDMAKIELRLELLDLLRTDWTKKQ